MKRDRMMLAAAAAVALLFLLTLGASRASADIFTSDLNSPNTAISPYPANYGTVTVNLTNATTATVTFNSGSSGGFTYLFIDSSAADLNVNASSFTSAFDSATYASTVYPSGGFQAGSFVGFGSGNVDSEGSFNLTTDMFDGTDRAQTQIVLTLTNTGGSWASAADVLTPNSAGNDAAAHIVVFNSSDVVNGQQLATGFAGEAVPDGGVTLMLFGGALVGIETLRRRFRV